LNLANFFFLRVYKPKMGEDQKIEKKKKNDRGQYQATLTEQAWSIKDLF